MYLSFKDTDEQRMRLRLRVLPEQAFFKREAGKHNARRDLQPYDKLLQTQLHRGTVPVVGGIGFAEQDDGVADGDGNKTAQTI